MKHLLNVVSPVLITFMQRRSLKHSHLVAGGNQGTEESRVHSIKSTTITPLSTFLRMYSSVLIASIQVVLGKSELWRFSEQN